jgi:hypothetical protein
MGTRLAAFLVYSFFPLLPNCSNCDTKINVASVGKTNAMSGEILLASHNEAD